MKKIFIILIFVIVAMWLVAFSQVNIVEDILEDDTKDVQSN